jgi:hypothetical protein
MIVDIFIVFIWQAERSERKGEHFEPVEDLSRANHSREYFMFPRLVKIGFCTSMFDKNERATGTFSCRHIICLKRAATDPFCH